MKFNLKSISIVIGISALIALGLWRPWENAERETPQIDPEEIGRPNTPIDQHVQCGYAKVTATVSCDEPDCWDNANNPGDELVKEVEMSFVRSTKEGCLFTTERLHFTTKANGNCDQESWYKEAIKVETNVDPADIISGPTISAWQHPSIVRSCGYTVTVVVKKT